MYRYLFMKILPFNDYKIQSINNETKLYSKNLGDQGFM